MRVVMAGSTMLDSWGGDVLLPKVLRDMGRVGGVKVARVMATCKRGEAHKVNVLPHLTVLLTHKNEAAWRKFVTHSFSAVQRSNSDPSLYWQARCSFDRLHARRCSDL